MAFLGIVTLDYCAWVGYSFMKCYCDATIYMIISSIVGAVVSSFYFFIGLLRDIGRITEPVIIDGLLINEIINCMLTVFR